MESGASLAGRRNFWLNVLDGAVFAFGLSFASRSTVLPVFVKSAGGGNVAVGLIPAIWVLGFNFPQIFVANHARQQLWKKKLVLRTALLQRLPWLILALTAFFLVEAVPPATALVVFFAGFALAAIGGSLNLPAWFDLIAKVTPVNLRGRLFATRTVLGAVLGVIGGVTVEHILNTMASPDSFGLLFAVAFGVMMISYVFLTLLREDEPSESGRRLRYREYLSELPQILRREQVFRNFLIAEALIITAMTAEAFFAVDAIESFGLSEGYAGRFTMIIMATMIVATPGFGYAADRFGHRLTLVLGALSMAAASVIAVAASSIELYYIVFVAAALTVAIRNISHLSIIAEICRERDRATYVALASMLTAPFVLFGLLGGWLADRLGYDVVFTAAALIAGASAVWMSLKVPEPRSLS